MAATSGSSCSARTCTGSTAAPTAPPRDLPKYGADRMLGTPISENAFTGLAGGLALDGRFRPVVEFMYPDFMWVAADQVFNQIGKARHMFGGDNPVPLVLRTKVAMGSGYGSQHLMDPAGIFTTSPGWRIVAPSTAADYVGLMNAALALQDPVLVIEHVDLYGTADQVPEGDLDYVIPPGRAAMRREGSDVTVISYLSMVAHSARSHRADRHRRRTDRPALARPRLDRLGHHRREHQEDERGADRRAGRARHLVRRLAGRRDPAPALRLARPAGRPGDRRGGVSEHLERPRARRDRPHRRSRRRARAVRVGMGSADGHRHSHARGARRRLRGRHAVLARRRGTPSRSGSRSPRSRPTRPSSSTPRRSDGTGAGWSPTGRDVASASRSRCCWRRKRPTPTIDARRARYGCAAPPAMPAPDARRRGCRRTCPRDQRPPTLRHPVGALARARARIDLGS